MEEITYLSIVWNRRITMLKIGEHDHPGINSLVPIVIGLGDLPWLTNYARTDRYTMDFSVDDYEIIAVRELTNQGIK